MLTTCARSTYYSLPADGAAALAALIAALGGAHHSVLVQMYALSHPDLIAALIAAKDRMPARDGPGVAVSLVLDLEESRNLDIAAQLQPLLLHGFTREMVTFTTGPGTRSQAMHRNVCVIDSHLVVAGSGSWSRGGFLQANTVQVTQSRAWARALTDDHAAMTAWGQQAWPTAQIGGAMCPIRPGL